MEIQNSKIKDQNQNSKIKISLEERSRLYAVRTIRFLNDLSVSTSSRIIAAQLIRSAASVGANIAEARAASSKKDFANFFTHALKSANESSYWFKLLKEAERIQTPLLEELLKESSEIANILAASILTMKGKTKF
jgi:four helix bundle protein